MSSPLEHYRSRLSLKLPSVFQEKGGKVVPGETPKVRPEIASLFPHTSTLPFMQCVKGEGSKSSPLRVGVVLSGGQAPGGHNVICALGEALRKKHPQSQLWGFLEGPSGIIEGRYKELTAEGLAPYLNTGGFDLIGSGRTKIETPEQFEKSLQVCTTLKLDGLVIIGGDDSNTNAALLAEFFLKKGCKTRVVGVPKTIDGDLKNGSIETSFGFDTACKIYSESIGNLCRDALSAKKYTHFVRLMGRSASHIALECALQTHPNGVLIGEEVAAKQMTLAQITDQLCEVIVKRAALGKMYGLFLIPEGLIEFVPEMKMLISELNVLLAAGKGVEGLTPAARQVMEYLPPEIAKQLLLERDPHGNVQVSHIATEQLLLSLVQKQLKTRNDYKGRLHPVTHFLGYEGRCGFPSFFDAHYCYALGFTAAALIEAGCSGYMSVINKLKGPVDQWEPAGIPLTSLFHLEKRKGKEVPVIQKALVDLQGAPFKELTLTREKWSTEDLYRYPGPIQFAGPQEIVEATTLTLQLEQDEKLTRYATL